MISASLIKMRCAPNMFNSYEFTFAGKSSLMYGLILYDIGGNSQDDVGFGNKASIIEARTVNRIKPIHYGVNYHEEPLQFRLVFGAERALDRYEMEDIALWLTGHQDYQWLSIDQPDLSHVQFKCLITDLKPISHGWLPVAFEATVRCDCPYAYGTHFEKKYQISGVTNISFRNNSSVWEYFKPVIKIIPQSGVQNFSIVNHSDNDRLFAFDGVPASGLEIIVDNENGVLYNNKDKSLDLYQFFNMNFFRLVRGNNNLEVAGDSELVISGRFLHNVAG